MVNKTQAEVYFKGRSVKCPWSSSIGEVREICRNGSIEVKITEHAKGSHHKEGDIVIWKKPIPL